jgi:DNA-binding transcriptional LysR family regulator
MPLNLRQLEMFQLIMQTRNLTEAARLLRISQPAVSQALKELEGQLGLVLFVRNGSRITPSGEARALLPEVERLLSQLSAVEGRAAELRDAGAGTLLLASMPNVAGCILPGAIAAFMRERPRVRVRLNGYVIGEVVRQVRREGADLGFVYMPVDDPSIAIEPLLQGGMVCVMPAGHRLAACAELLPAQLADELVILVDPANTPGLLLRRRLDEAGVRLEQVIETNLGYAALALAQERMGIFITDPIVLLNGSLEGLAVVPLRPTLTVTLAAVYGRQRPVPRLATRFMAHLRLSLPALCQRLQAIGCEAKAL